MMVPRGYWGKESMHPHFTTPEYRASDQAKEEQARLDAIKQWFVKVWQGVTKGCRKAWGYYDKNPKITNLL